jgi:hypothetical protein
MAAWTPKGFQHIREWLDDELQRRGHKVEDDPAWARAFDDLADFLAEDWTQAERFALFVCEDGSEPYVVPLREWRKSPPAERAKLAETRTGIVSTAGGVWHIDDGYVAIREDLRLDMKPSDQSSVASRTTATSNVTNTTPITEKPLKEFLTKLDREYAGKPAPSLKAIDDAGRAQFGKRWRKTNRDRRNDTDLTTGAQVYPNLYCTTRGKRRSV